MFVKICGITNEEDALFAVAMGADAVGFVFAPSPRQIQPTQARDIVRRLPHETLTVGVFRDETPQRVAEIVNRSASAARSCTAGSARARSRGCASGSGYVIKAFGIDDPALEKVADYEADAIMIDSRDAGLGPGVRLDPRRQHAARQEDHPRRRAHPGERAGSDPAGASRGVSTCRRASSARPATRTPPR